jgi:hypothetical protein
MDTTEWMVEKDGALDATYFDGDTGSALTHRWTGTVNASTSEQVNASGTLVQTNWAINPNLETNASTWYGANDALFTFSRDTTAPITGTASAMTTKTASASGGAGVAIMSGILCTPGIPLTSGVDGRAERAGRRVNLTYQWRNSGGSYISTSPGSAYQTLVAGTVYRAQLTATPPALAVSAELVVSVITVDGSNAVTGERVWFDNVRAGGDGSYFDGSSAATPPAVPNPPDISYEWVGTPRASLSHRLGPVPDYLQNYYLVDSNGVVNPGQPNAAETYRSLW